MGNPEQFELNFGKAEVKNPEIVPPEIELHERDECEACGNMFESFGSCRQCMGNKMKQKWMTERNKKTTH